MKSDDICERYSKNKVNLTIRLLEPEEGKTVSDMVLIEGSPQALKMMAELLETAAEDSANDGFSISPFGAGKIHFSENAELGVYIHCLRDSN